MDGNTSMTAPSGAQLNVSAKVQHLIDMVSYFANLSDSELASEKRSIGVALAISAIREAIGDPVLASQFVDEMNSLPYDQISRWEEEGDGEIIYSVYESQELGDDAERVLAWRYRREAKAILISAIASCKLGSESHSLPAPTPRLPLAFVEESRIRAELLGRWEEAWKCTNLGLLLSASVVLGSVLEGALLYFCENIVTQETRDTHHLKGNPDSWRLHRMVEAVLSVVDFRAGLAELTHQIRDERNYIHPNVSLKSAPLTAEALQTNFAIIGELLSKLSGHAAQVKP